jgi:serine/threonine-protein kinase
MVVLTLLDPQTLSPLKQWRFEEQTLVRIGRAPENDVILNSPIVSRFHLELRRIDQGIDLRSSDHPTPALENPPPNPPEAGHWQLINSSVNGTFWEGKLLTEEWITQSMVIQLAQGGPILRIEPFQASLGRPISTNHCNHSGNPPENLFCIHCGQPVQVEKIVRQYQVLRVLGRGGMGTTYLIWDPMTVTNSTQPGGTLQVLKEMNADIARIPKAQELFEREASTLKNLNHPGIPRYYDFFIENGRKYLVMELIHGQDLEKRVRQQGSVSAQQAIEWMLQTCDVLHYLHTQPHPIIHRDVKPGNLLVRNLDNQIVLLDFGAVKAAGMPPGTRIGAEGYSAPEQIQGRPTIQSDLYAVGSSLIFLLTGESPQRLIRRDEQGSRLEVENVQSIPGNLRQIIAKVTQPEPSDRFQTAQALIHALKRCQ